MKRNDILTTDELCDAACRRLPVLTAAEQRAGIVLLREMARGKPVALAQFARGLDTPTDTANSLMKRSALGSFVYADEEGQVQGFWGLSVTHTHHQLMVKGRTLWAWCAQDTLFLPELLGDIAEIESGDPETGQLIRLTVSPARIEAVEPAGVVVSMVRPETWDVTSADRVMASACHFIFFFATRASGELWQAKHPETTLLSLDEAFAVAKRWNAHVFGAELARYRADAA